jgi:hypothetical protein
MRSKSLSVWPMSSGKTGRWFQVQSLMAALAAQVLSQGITMHQEKSPTHSLHGSMWVQRNPFEMEYARRTSLLSLLRCTLPTWLGGKPLRTLRAQSKSGWLRSRSLDVDLELQLTIARAQGKSEEAHSLTLRLADLKAARKTKNTAA